MNKKLIALVLAAVLVAALFCGCEFHSSNTSTTTTTNADGTTTTVTTSTTNDNGKVTSTTTTTTGDDTTTTETDDPYYEGISVAIVNDTTFDFTGLKISNSNDEVWGDNFLENLEGGILPAGNTLTGLTMSYYASTPCFDIKILDQNGEECIFEGVDFTGWETACQLHFVSNADGTVNVTIEAAE